MMVEFFCVSQYAQVNEIRPSTQRFLLSNRLADGHISLRYLLAPLASFCLAGRLRSLLTLTDVSSSNTATMQEGLMSPVGDGYSACVYCLSSLRECGNLRHSDGCFVC